MPNRLARVSNDDLLFSARGNRTWLIRFWLYGTGASSLLRAFTRDDFPADPEEIFLTSWGEWWGKDVFAKALDKELQDRWCPSKEDIEKEEGLVA